MTNYAELTRLAEAATPGPWEIDEARQIFAKSVGEYVAITEIEDFDPIPFEQGAKDAEFIAAANPAVLLILLAENDALRKAVKFSVEQFEKISSGDGSGHADIARAVLRIAGKSMDKPCESSGQ